MRDSMANHGFLPRDGKNISLPVLIAACEGTPLSQHRQRHSVLRLEPCRRAQCRPRLLRADRDARLALQGSPRKGWRRLRPRRPGPAQLPDRTRRWDPLLSHLHPNFGSLWRRSVSISRQDAYFGDNHSFNATIFQTVKNSAHAGFHNVESAGEVRRLRLIDSQKRNPELLFLAQHDVIALGEAALYLSVMGDPVRRRSRQPTAAGSR
jgi:hypothetical protein